MDLAIRIAKSDPRTWNFYRKLTFSEVCIKFGIDIHNDRRITIYLAMRMGVDIKITENILDILGFYEEPIIKHYTLMESTNTGITQQIYRDIITRIQSNLFQCWTFNGLMHNLTNEKVIKLRQLFSNMTLLSTRYDEYEKLFAENQLNELKLLIIRQSDQLNSLTAFIQAQNEINEHTSSSS